MLLGNSVILRLEIGRDFFFFFWYGANLLGQGKHMKGGIREQFQTGKK